MISIKQCVRDNSCYKCNDENCLHKGDMRSDCPKYRCDRKGSEYEDCESCKFIKEFLEEVYCEQI